MAKQLEVKALTPELYDNKYGQVVTTVPLGQPLLDDERLKYWSNVVSLEQNMNHYFGLLVVKKRPVVLKEMERHVKSQEFFIPIDGQCLMFFAPAKDADNPDEKPDINEIECFKIDSSIAGFVVNRGTWHYPAFPLTPTASQLIAMRDNLESDDVQICQLPEAIKLDI